MRQGIQVLPVVIGILALSELFRSMRQSFRWSELAQTFSAKFPSLKTLWRVTPRVFLGTVIGTFVGAIPGLGGPPAAFISYQQSKLFSKHPEEYGHGSIEGLAANEGSQNACQAGEMVPTFGFGIPGSSTMVFLLAALLIHGLVPGPLLIRHSPHLLYSATYGLLSITFIIALLGWHIQRLLLKVVTFDRSLVLTGAVGLCIIGVFSFNRSIFDVFVMLLSGMIGYIMRRYGYSVAATSLAMILGNGFESNLRSGLLLARKSWWAFVTRPWTALFLGMSLVLLIYGTIGTIRLSRKAAAARRQALAIHQEDLVEKTV
jgi:putative tricarboxylic transport membrane protein